MKIITPGMDRPGDILAGACRTCGCVVEVGEPESVGLPWWLRWGRDAHDRAVKCPNTTCNDLIVVSPKSLNQT